VLLAGIVVLDLVRGQSEGGSSEQRAARLLAMDEKIRATGTTTVTFRTMLRPAAGVGGVTWAGTSKVKWSDDDPATDTEFTEIKPAAFRAAQARRVFDGSNSYYRSPVFQPADKRPWINNGRTGMFWADRLSDPELHLPDYTMWQSFLRYLTEDNAYAALTEDLADVDGAPHEYQLTCAAGEDPGCPPPFPTPLNQFFNDAPVTTWSIWLADDGLPRRVDVRSVLLWDATRAKPGDSGVPAVGGEYEFTGSFLMSGYGDPVTIEAPPAAEVTQVTVVNALK
jgi:hypothetical protein